MKITDFEVNDYITSLRMDSIFNQTTYQQFVQPDLSHHLVCRGPLILQKKMFSVISSIHRAQRHFHASDTCLHISSPDFSEFLAYASNDILGILSHSHWLDSLQN